MASVILQSARKVGSDETRLYLTDAHGRVMSVAALQLPLAASRLGEVKVGYRGVEVVGVFADIDQGGEHRRQGYIAGVTGGGAANGLMLRCW